MSRTSQSTSQSTSRYFYGASYPYGVATSTVSGRLIRDLYAFSSRAERDAWVDDAPGYIRSASGYREAIRARDIAAHEEARDWTEGWLVRESRTEIAARAR